MQEGRGARLVRRTVWSALVLAVIGVGIWFGGWSWWARSEFQAAQEAFDRHDLDAAQTHLEHCRQVWPDEPKIHFLAAQVARRAGDFEKAEAHLQSYQRSQKHNEAIALERALMRVQTGDLPSGLEEHLRRLADDDGPEAVLILEALAQGCQRNYQLFKALEYYNRLLERRPDDVPALLATARLYQGMNRLAEAAGSYERVLKLNDSNEVARLRLAQVLLALGRDQLTRATELFERLHEHQPDNLEISLGLAQCRSQAGQVNEAAQLLDAALAQHSEEITLLLERAQLALRQGQAPQAEGWLRRVLVQSPQNYPANQALLRCLELQGKKEAAKECASRLKDIEADMNRLEGLMQQLQGRPQDPDLRHEIGQTLMRRGMEQEAVQWFQSALRFDPSHKLTHKTLAEYAFRKGNKDQAVEHARMAGMAGP